MLRVSISASGQLFDASRGACSLRYGFDPKCFDPCFNYLELRENRNSEKGQQDVKRQKKREVVLLSPFLSFSKDLTGVYYARPVSGPGLGGN